MVVMMGELLPPAVLAVRVLFAALGRLKPVVVVVVVVVGAGDVPDDGIGAFRGERRRRGVPRGRDSPGSGHVQREVGRGGSRDSQPELFHPRRAARSRVGDGGGEGDEGLGPRVRGVPGGAGREQRASIDMEPSGPGDDRRGGPG